MELIRVTICALVLAALSACGSPIGDIAQVVWDNRNAEEDAPAPPPRVNRAAIEQADLAAIVVTGERFGLTAIAAAVQKREDRIVYNSNENRGVTLQGGLVYTTLGFGANLQAVLVAPGDPLVEKLPPDAWPDRVSRTYLVSGRGPVFDRIDATCTIRRGDEAVIDVVRANRNAVALTEVCTTDAGERFVNQHFIDPSDGEMWRSLQWTGPMQGYVLVDVVEPFTG
ncbi:MAG: YjbF family lipoprotein [Pseudomonadota bacterium]